MSVILAGVWRDTDEILFPWARQSGHVGTRGTLVSDVSDELAYTKV